MFSVLINLLALGVFPRYYRDTKAGHGGTDGTDGTLKDATKRDKRDKSL